MTFGRIFVSLSIGYVAREAGIGLAEFIAVGALFAVCAFVFSAVAEGFARARRAHEEHKKNG